MRTNLRLKSLASLALCLMSALFAASCTSDEFFGIEENYEGLDYPVLCKIANSKEYIEFQKESLLFMESMNNIDTTIVKNIGEYEGKPIYAVGELLSMKSYVEAREKLVELYPEYETTTDDEKNQIFNLAIMNNKELRKIAQKSAPLSINKTKSINYDSYAVRYVKLGDAEMRSTVDGGEWAAGSITWYTRDDFSTVVSMALSGTESTGKEFGGYYFGDGSGILNVDPSATSSQMCFAYYPISGTYSPIMDFHIHPSNNLNPSEQDVETWESMPWSFHYIYGANGDLQAYEL